MVDDLDGAVGPAVDAVDVADEAHRGLVVRHRDVDAEAELHPDGLRVGRDGALEVGQQDRRAAGAVPGGLLGLAAGGVDRLAERPREQVVPGCRRVVPPGADPGPVERLEGAVDGGPEGEPPAGHLARQALHVAEGVPARARRVGRERGVALARRQRQRGEVGGSGGVDHGAIIPPARATLAVTARDARACTPAPTCARARGIAGNSVAAPLTGCHLLAEGPRRPDRRGSSGRRHMGSARSYICRACGTSFMARDGGGFLFDLLHCDACGATASVTHKELGDVHLGFVKGLPGPYAVARAELDAPDQGRVPGRAADEGPVPRSCRGDARRVRVRRPLPLRRAGPLPGVPVHRRAVGRRPRRRDDVH